MTDIGISSLLISPWKSFVVGTHCKSSPRWISTTYDIQRGKRALLPHANREGSNDMRIRSIWSGHSLFLDIYYSFHWFCKWDNEGPDQPAQMCRLIRACVVRKLHKSPFHPLCILPFYGEISKMLQLLVEKNWLAWSYGKIIYLEPSE